MAAGTTLTFDILAKDKASKTIDGIDKKSRNLGKTLGNLAGIAAGVAVVGGVTMLTSFIKDAAEAAKIGRITEQVIKSTGSAAKITAQQVSDLSQELSNKTAIDDELVQTGANLLLTFKNIRNEAGKGNKIFDQATAAALDLSAAGFGSVESAAKMLGKALNDPLKGLTALGRAGVTFTAEQKETITALVEQGDILSAQKIIMSEIASQVGGAAEAAADPIAKLKVVMENLGEEIGTVLLPYVQQFATWLADEGAAKIQEWIAIFRDEWIPTIRNMIVVFRDEWWPVIREVWGFVTDVFSVAWDFISMIYDRLNTAGDRWGERLRAVLDAVGIAWGFWRDLVIGVWEWIKRTFEDGVRAVANFMFEFVEVILDSAEAAFGWIPGLGPKIREAQEKFSELRAHVNQELSKISDEEIKINITAGGLQRVAASAAASAAARFQGGSGGAGSGGSTLRPFMPALTGTGGSLGVRTTGMDANKIAAIAASLGDKAGDTAFAEMQRLFKAGAFFGPSGPGIPGSGRLFPLPAGTYRRSQGPHDGGAIDYAAPYGTPVRASFSGYLNVTDLGNRSYGKFYQLTGAGQRTILGAHLSSFSHGDGPISRGQLIGKVGSTGNSTGPHLHLLGFDQGGWLPPGPSLVVNNTGKPEKVTAPDQAMRLHRDDIKAIGRVIASEMAATVGGSAYAAGRRADLLARAG